MTAYEYEEVAAQLVGLMDVDGEVDFRYASEQLGIKPAYVIRALRRLLKEGVISYWNEKRDDGWHKYFWIYR